ncbi:MAG: T9SS type A sorting domain-containing protein [Chitinophagaceae bacterium]|nr:T9SS type A sorting domain-containing protein [Chitinophagaceae bacterium]
MTKKQIILLVLSIAMLRAQSQPVIDGVINASENYIQIGTYSSTNNSFGNDNDLGALYYRYGISGGLSYIYVGITGRIDGSNNIVLFMDFSNYAGRSTGTLGGGTTSNMGVFSTSTGAGDCGGNGGLNGVRMSNGFDADYAFAFNEGGSATNLYCDAMRFSALGSTPDGYFEQGYAGTVNQTGTSGNLTLPFSIGCGANCPGSMTLAYRGDYNPPTVSNSGIEMRIPVQALPGVAPGDYVRFFVVITNQFGFMSNESIPSMSSAGNPGCDADLSGQTDLFTGLWLLPFNFLDFEATPGKNSVQLQWKVSGNREQQQYLVEKSANGISFETISTITATMADEQFYHAVDTEPWAGWNFYRITAIDGVQRKRSSIIKRIYYGMPVTTAIAPNPVKGNVVQLLTGGLAKGVYTIRLVSLDGKLLFSRRWVFEGTQPTYRFETNAPLPAGMYWLVLQTGNQPPVRLKMIQQ